MFRIRVIIKFWFLIVQYFLFFRRCFGSLFLASFEVHAFCAERGCHLRFYILE